MPIYGSDESNDIGRLAELSDFKAPSCLDDDVATDNASNGLSLAAGQLPWWDGSGLEQRFVDGNRIILELGGSDINSWG